MIPMPILEALIKGGVIGAVLAWALLQNVRLTEKLFTVIENNTAAVSAFANQCREAAR